MMSVTYNPPRGLLDLLSRPEYVLHSLLVLYTTIDYTTNPTDNVVLRLGNYLGDTYAGQFISGNAVKFIGLTQILSAVLWSGHRGQFAMALCLSAIVCAAPSISLLAYAVTSYGLTIFLSTPDRSTRVFLTTTALLAIYIAYSPASSAAVVPVYNTTETPTTTTTTTVRPSTTSTTTTTTTARPSSTTTTTTTARPSSSTTTVRTTTAAAKSTTTTKRATG